MRDSATDDVFVAFPSVKAKTGLSRSTIYAKIGAGTFPPPIKLGRASRWSIAEIREWMAAQRAERDARAA